MFGFLKSKDVKEVINHFKEFKALEQQALLTDDEDVLTVLESDMANIALIMKINSRKDPLIKEELSAILLKEGYPSCKEFSDYDENSIYISKNKEVSENLPEELFEELFTIYKSYRKKIKKAQKLVSLRKYLKMEAVINEYCSIEELFQECQREFSEIEYDKIMSSLKKIQSSFLKKAKELSSTEVYFKEDLEERIYFIFRENQLIQVTKDKFKILEINSLELFLSKKYLVQI